MEGLISLGRENKMAPGLGKDCPALTKRPLQSENKIVLFKRNVNYQVKLRAGKMVV